MASVIINELDNTASEVYSPTETVVFIPGMLGDGVTDVDQKFIGVPTLYTDELTFCSDMGETPRKCRNDSEGVEYDKSYVMARQLLALGMHVLYEVIPYVEGNATRDARTYEEAVTTLRTSDFWQGIADRSLYNPRFITSGGYHSIEEADRTMANAMIDLASFRLTDDDGNSLGRGDCVALIDHPKSLRKVEDIDALFNSDDSIPNGSFAAAFTPWCNFALSINLPNIDTSAEDITEEGPTHLWALPASFAYLVAYNNMLSGSETWFAAAGKARGKMPLLYKPLIELGDKACKGLQSRKEGHIAVNPITNIRPYGYRIYGNRTLRQNEGGLKATSFLNIRNLLSDIKKVCYQSCRIESFEQNTDILWANLKSLITPLLEKMKTGQGLEGYDIKKVPTKDRAKVVGKIILVPIEAVEDFVLNIELTDSLEIETEGE